MKKFKAWIDGRAKKPNGRDFVGMFAATIGLFSNLLLFSVKFIIGLISQSVAIMADAINNLSDTISSILTLVGFFFARKPADNEHPYGHQRSEAISGQLVSILMIIVGVQFLSNSVQKIFNPAPIKLSALVLILLILSIVVKFLQSAFYNTVGKQINSKTLMATAQDSRNDVLTTIVVVISSALEMAFGWQIDGYTGLLIALYIILSGAKMLKGFFDELLGERPKLENIEKIRSILNDEPRILGYHDLMIHNYGAEQNFATVDIEIDSSLTLNQGHSILDALEKRVLHEAAIHLVTHLDPVDVRDDQRSMDAKIVQRELQKIKGFKTFHDFRIDYPNHHLSFDVVMDPDAENDQLVLKQIHDLLDPFFPKTEMEVVIDRIDILS